MTSEPPASTQTLSYSASPITYSPDLNPIEHHWAILKARLRKVMAPRQSLEQALDETLMVYQ